MNKLITGLLLLLMFAFISCNNEEVLPSQAQDSEVVLRGGKPNTNGGDKGKGKGKGGNDDTGGTGEEDPVIEYGETYQLLEHDDYDPLYRFSFSIEGDQVLFQTDSTVTTWGTDYWGYWDEPFPYADGVVEYISGLSLVTYEFTPVGGDVFDVTRRLIVGSYNSTHSDTTYSHPGLYVRVE